jgi:hypothetical protein
MPFHIAPILRERENAAIAAGLLINQSSTGYTVRRTQETSNIVPTPVITAAGGIGNTWFGGSNLVGNLGQLTTPTL